MTEVFRRFFCSQYGLKVSIKIVVLTDLNLDETQISDLLLRLYELCDLMVLVTGWIFRFRNPDQTRY